MLPMLGAFVVTIALLLITLRLIRRLHGGVSGHGRVPLTVLQRISTGQRQGIGLLRVADRVLVVSFAEHGTTLLSELSGDALAQALAHTAPSLVNTAPSPSLTPTRGPHTAPTPFAAIFDRVRKVGVFGLALVLATTALHAQQPAAPATAPAAAPAAPATSKFRVPETPTAATARLRAQQLQAAQAQQAGAPKVPSVPTVQQTIPINPIAPKPGRTAGPHGPSIPVPSVTGPNTPKVEFNIGQGDSQLKLTGTVGLVVFLGAMTLLPALFLLMTSFTRILIVLHFLRSALGTQTAPPSQVLVALAVLLTGVVMHPVLDRASNEALTPYFDGRLTQVEAYNKGVIPFREFMLANLRLSDLESFAEMSGIQDVKDEEELPTTTIVAAFVTSELRTSFQMGFAIFLPFIVVDLIVASVLMSMGMMMLPPAMVSLPFKLLLFVLADGWTLVVRNLVSSFRV